MCAGALLGQVSINRPCSGNPWQSLWRCELIMHLEIIGMPLRIQLVISDSAKCQIPCYQRQRVLWNAMFYYRRPLHIEHVCVPAFCFGSPPKRQPSTKTKTNTKTNVIQPTVWSVRRHARDKFSTRLWRAQDWHVRTHSRHNWTWILWFRHNPKDSCGLVGAWLCAKEQLSLGFREGGPWGGQRNQSIFIQFLWGWTTGWTMEFSKSNYFLIINL